MSLLSELATSLGATGAQLPLPEVRRAAQEVDTASRRLAAALAHAQHPAPVRALGAALEHLDSASGALLLAQHSIQGYLTSVGATAVPPPSTVDNEPAADWWVQRVAQLTRCAPSSRPSAAPGTTTDLLRAALDPAQSGDRYGLAEVLAGAHPPVGLGLAALTAPLIQHHADLAERPSAALSTVGHLLPGLPSGVAESILAHRPGRPWDRHPADAAITGTALLAGLLNLLGRKGFDAE
jgi:hypothetical protein